mmetsp:Transcript_23444/g.48668  ORF Transcript_23444/g.48668 Transcript_23444/m.48668 type:complete len:322 (-) Transcript_23444:37-1002(-)
MMKQHEPYLILTSWGLDLGSQSSWEPVLRRVKSAGYHAIEAVGAFSFEGKALEFRQVLDRVGLDLIVQIHTDGGYFNEKGAYIYCKTSHSVDLHVDSFRQQLQDETLLKVLSPKLLNVHAGHDSWDHEQNVKFLLEAQDIIDSIPSLKNKVSFETHRMRIMYNPHDTRRLLRDERLNGKIHTTADLSHWCCVCMTIFDAEQEERDAPWWPETLQLVAQHAALVHARVGYDQSPQVPDPRDPAYEYAVQQHLKWWKIIWEKQLQSKKTPMVTMEFGPLPYMQSLPYTGQPVASQWDVNNAMRDIVCETFKDLGPAEKASSSI